MSEPEDTMTKKAASREPMSASTGGEDPGTADVPSTSEDDGDETAEATSLVDP